MNTIKNDSQDEKELILATVEKALPSLVTDSIEYNNIVKMFLTPSWTSAAGNSYQQGYRISDVLVAEYEIGHGYFWTFLNGIRIYRFEGNKRVLIGERYFNSYKWCESNVNNETINLLSDYIGQQFRLVNGAEPNSSYIKQISETLVSATIEKTKLIGA